LPSKPANELQRGDVVLVTDSSWPTPVYAKVTGTRAAHFKELIPLELQPYATQAAAVCVYVDYETPVRIGEGRDDVTRQGAIFHHPTDKVKFRKADQ
jgi:hypothetical protein